MALLGKVMVLGGLAGQVITLLANLYALYGAGHASAQFLSDAWWDSWWFAYAILGPVIVLGGILVQINRQG